MKSSSPLAALVLAGVSSANPIIKRQLLSEFNDADILNYALTLEHLEAAFYREALANYSASAFSQPDPFYANLQIIAADEASHVEFLTTALTAAGFPAVEACIYDFPSTDPDSFLAVANVLEGVGVSAYLGAARQIADPDYLTAAASILTVEARHSAYIRAVTDLVPFAKTRDDPLSPRDVQTLAAPFFVSCPPGNADIGVQIQAFPALAVTAGDSATVAVGSTVSVATDGYVLAPGSDGAELFAAFITAEGPIYATYVAVVEGTQYAVTIPEGVAGQSYLVFTECGDGSVNDDTTVAGPAVIEMRGARMTGGIVGAMAGALQSWLG